jgi:hypothetical protein
MTKLTTVVIYQILSHKLRQPRQNCDKTISMITSLNYDSVKLDKLRQIHCYSTNYDVDDSYDSSVTARQPKHK